MLARLRALRGDLIDPTIALHHGRVVRTPVRANGRRRPQRPATNAISAAFTKDRGGDDGLWRRFMLLRCAKRYAGKPAERRSAHPATRCFPAVTRLSTIRC